MRVTYPAFSEIQDDKDRLRSSYKSITNQLSFWIFPLLIFSSILSKPLILFVYGPNWIEAAPMFSILCLAGLLIPHNSYNLNILKAIGKSGLYLKLELIKKTIKLTGLLISINFGIMVMLYFIVIDSFIEFVLNGFFSGKEISHSLQQQFNDLIPQLVISIASGFILYVALPLTSKWPSILVLIIFYSGGFLFYLFLAQLFCMNQHLQVLGYVRKVIR
jgi:O-antigen/teichoic acid export membrane protein